MQPITRITPDESKRAPKRRQRAVPMHERLNVCLVGHHAAENEEVVERRAHAVEIRAKQASIELHWRERTAMRRGTGCFEVVGMMASSHKCQRSMALKESNGGVGTVEKCAATRERAVRTADSFEIPLSGLNSIVKTGLSAMAVTR